MRKNDLGYEVIDAPDYDAHDLKQCYGCNHWSYIPEMKVVANEMYCEECIDTAIELVYGTAEQRWNDREVRDEDYK